MTSLVRFPNVLNNFYKYRGRNIIKRAFSTDNNHYDIIIAGGGMVGTTLACTLGKNKKFSNKRILLLEAGNENSWKLTDTYSNRVVALNPRTRALFTKIGVWRAIEDMRYGVVKKMQVWDAISDSMITFENDDMTDPVAYIIENDMILSTVEKETKQLDNVTIFNGAKIKECKLVDHESSMDTITLDDNRQFTCELLLGCDGVKSKIRETMDVQWLSWDYHQMGVVATLLLSESPDNIVAWQRFLPTGPIAFLPLKDNLSSLVWSTTTEHAKELLALNNEQFVEAINDAMWKTYNKNSIVSEMTNMFDSFMKSLNKPSNAVRQLPPKVSSIVEKSRAAFPLGFGHAANYVKPGVALVGDAAHRIHPMAGQGVNLGFGDIEVLETILGDAIYSGSKMSDLKYLKDYECERQRHNLPTMLAIEGLHRLYNTEWTPAVLLRSLGLQFTHALNPLKKSIIKQAAV